MSKTKNLSKLSKIPQPIKVKKEKTEEDRAIHSMAHYVDDRLELVKQIFGSLKTKTITNLAPEYLKSMKMEKIQEYCLNELLCLSTKRLFSIINDTKCPTDTESSDDSDVEAKEEHVSLEEISSDSEIEKGGKSSKRERNNAKKAIQKTHKAETHGHISVLELLELQARARAIRSQLALEPVTKIEVDSDDAADPKDISKKTKTTKEKKNSLQLKEPNSKHAEKSTLSSSIIEKDEKYTARVSKYDAKEFHDGNSLKKDQSSNQKIKIKRNFRNGNQTERETSSGNSEHNVVNASAKSQQHFPASKDVKKEKRSRSPSPDVIPILHEPEVLNISDSSSDEESIYVNEFTVEAKQSTLTTQISEEAEDGEIVEQVETVKEMETPVEAKVDDQAFRLTTEKSNLQKENTETHLLTHDNCIKQKNEDSHTKITEENAQNGAETDNLEAEKSHYPQHLTAVKADDHGEQCDDVISIEGGDLENEMSEHLDDKTCSKQSGQSVSALVSVSNNNDPDIVSLDSSEIEDEVGNEGDTESWQSRYMRSSKVNNVLAVSRLGKRVRDKLKTTKNTMKKANPNNSSKDDRAKSSKYVSKHEDGSVEQYKELLEMSQRSS